MMSYSYDHPLLIFHLPPTYFPNTPHLFSQVFLHIVDIRSYFLCSEGPSSLKNPQEGVSLARARLRAWRAASPSERIGQQTAPQWRGR